MQINNSIVMVRLFVILMTLVFGLAFGCSHFDDDVIELGITFQNCVYLCDKTDACTSISYKQTLALCKMHVRDTTDPGCLGYMFLKKDVWTSDPSVQRSTGVKEFEKCPKCGKTAIGSRCSPRNPGYGKILGNRLSDGYKIMVKCNPGYIVKGTRQKTCEAGMTKPEEPHCVKDPKCVEYLVSGPYGVLDSQLTESSNWCSITTGHAECKEWYTSARYARINSTGTYTGGWMAGNYSGEAYIQVDFLLLKVLSAIVLQGRDPEDKYEYVTKFKVLTSKDCVTFEVINDLNGNEKLFNGTTGPNDIVVREVPVRKLIRCVRIQPTDWEGHPSLRFDILGCHYFTIDGA